jgi:hypothetical protein
MHQGTRAAHGHGARLVAAALAIAALLTGSLPAVAAPAAQPVIFGDGLLPPTGSSQPAGVVTIGCTVSSALGLATYQLLVDDAPLPTTLSGGGPWQLQASARLDAGPHTASVSVTDTAGQEGGWTWSFTVTGVAPATPTAAAPPSPTRPAGAAPTPAPPPAGASPTLQLLGPPADWLVPTGPQRIAVLFGSDRGFTARSVSLDGRPLTTQSEGAAAGHEALAALAPLTAGPHVIAADATDGAGRKASAQWTILASDPVGDGDVQIRPQAPAAGVTLPSGASVHLAARVESKADLRDTAILIDGRALPIQRGASPRTATVSADATGVAPGRHTVRVQATDSGGKSTAAAWDFYVGGPANPGERTLYAETGYSVSGPFRDYWNTLGPSALQVLGYPISGLLVERLNDGKAYTAQYFERVRLEWHPENRGSEFEVLYGLLGTTFHQPDPALAPAPPARAGERFFPETGHLVRGPFLQKWQSTGGLRAHGFPISEELQEVSPTDGRVYLVQYFQRARFEYHPENAGTPFDVLLGMLGRQLYTQRYPAP